MAFSEKQKQEGQRVSAEFNRQFNDVLRRTGYLTREPRYRYYQKDNGPMFFWTTEKYEADADWMADKYVSGVYRPTGPGSRSGKATRWELSEDESCGHALRKDAKARALKMYRAA